MPSAKEILRCLEFYKTKRGKKGKQQDIPADVLSILGELDLEHPKTPADQEALVTQLQELLQEARGHFKPLVEVVPVPAPADLAPKGDEVALEAVQSVATKAAPAVGASLNKSERKFQEKAEERGREIVELRKRIQELSEEKVVGIHEAQKAAKKKYDQELAKMKKELEEKNDEEIQQALWVQYAKAQKAAELTMLEALQQKDEEIARMEQDLEDQRQETARLQAQLAAQDPRKAHTVVADGLWEELQSYPVDRRCEIWNKMVKFGGWHTDKVQQLGLSNEGDFWKFVNRVCQEMNGKLN